MRWNKAKSIRDLTWNALRSHALQKGLGKPHATARQASTPPETNHLFVRDFYAWSSAAGEKYDGPLPSWRAGRLNWGHYEKFGSRFQLRSFRSSATEELKPQNEKYRKQSQYKENQRRNKILQHKEQQRRNKIRMKKLHPAAKMKRILSQLDYWFSRVNLPNDEYLKEELRDHAGHVPLSTIASFPRLEHWGDDPGLILQTLVSEAAKKRYDVIFNREAVERVERNRRRRKIRRRKEILQYLNRVRDDFCRKSTVEEDRDESQNKVTAEQANAASELFHVLRQHFESDPEFGDIGNGDAAHQGEDDDLVYDEEFPSPIADDGSSNFVFALVRPKKVKPEYYAQSSTNNDKTSDLEESHFQSDELDKGKDKTARSKTTKRPIKYSSNREVYVITNTTQLASFCRKLNTLLNSGPGAAIGFDVEYCSLDEDIRVTLPAMLTLASPDPNNGIVGLIWLDKFPNFGKDMIGDPDCEELLSFLSNPGISKVGVGATKDAKHLAAWWGIGDPDFVSFYFSGMVDLESTFDDSKLWEKGLQEMCEAVLGRDLPKIKEKNARKKKEMRVRGRRVRTSHWRRDSLTEEMKRYAADDASSVIDIWNKTLQS